MPAMSRLRLMACLVSFTAMRIVGGDALRDLERLVERAAGRHDAIDQPHVERLVPR